MQPSHLFALIMAFGQNCQSGKYVEKTKQQAPDAVLSVNPVKFGKAILHWDAQANKSHNMDYELIPQSEPKAGQPLDILVLVKVNQCKASKWV